MRQKLVSLGAGRGREDSYTEPIHVRQKRLQYDLGHLSSVCCQFGSGFEPTVQIIRELANASPNP